MRRGVSFIEIVIAVAILACIGLAVMTAISGSAREVKTTSEHSLSMFLSQKIIEDLLQSSHENDHYQDALAEINAQRIPVGNSAHPYFTAVEDSRPANGLLEPDKDLGIEASAPALFKLYREFNLTISSSDDALPFTVNGVTPQVKNVNMQFDWPGVKGGDLSTPPFPLSLSKPDPHLDPTPLAALDGPTLDTSIRQLIYPDVNPPNADLSTVCGKVGANLVVVRDLGKVCALTEWADIQGGTMDTAIAGYEAQLPALAADPQAEGELRIKLGGLYERKAAIPWIVLLYLKQPAQTQQSFSKSDLGSAGSYDPSDVKNWIDESAELIDATKDALVYALNQYTTARAKLGNLSSRLYRRMALEKKILELLKLRIMLEQTPDTSYLQQWQDWLIAEHKGRTRSFTDYLTRERAKTTSLQGIKDLDRAVSQRVDDANFSTTTLQQLAQRADQQLGP